MAVAQTTIFPDIFSVFYNLINSKVPDPSARDKQWIFSCADKDTDCLTEEGWKGIDTLKESDKIYTYEGKFEPLLQINRYAVNDIDMIKVETRDISMLLTPNHRVFCWQRSSTVRKYPRIILAKDMKDNICIPQLKEAVLEPECTYSDEFVELLGWIITEGFIHKKELTRGICIYQSQSANPEYVDMIRSLLIELGIGFTEHKRERKLGKLGKDSIEIEFYIKNKYCAEIRKAIPNKILTPKLIFALTKNQRRLLVETMLLGDGSLKGKTNWCYIQKGKYNIDIFAMLAILAGYRIHISKQTSGEDIYLCYVTSKSYNCIRKCNGAEIKKEKYSGLIWCPSVQSGIFLARRQGKVFFTGNSFPEADIIEGKIKYPIIIIEPVNMSWEQFTFTKKKSTIELIYNIYSTRMDQADSLLTKIVSVMDQNTMRLKWDNNLDFINLVDTDTGFEMRGGTRAHVRSANFSMEYIFKSGLGLTRRKPTINSNTVIV